MASPAGRAIYFKKSWLYFLGHRLYQYLYKVKQLRLFPRKLGSAATATTKHTICRYVADVEIDAIYLAFTSRLKVSRAVISHYIFLMNINNALKSTLIYHAAEPLFQPQPPPLASKTSDSRARDCVTMPTRPDAYRKSISATAISSISRTSAEMHARAHDAFL